MRLQFSVLGLAVVGASSVANAEDAPAYKSLRADEDYRYLREPERRTDGWDPLKYIPFDSAGTVYASLGGEMRERIEYFHDLGWGKGATNSTSWLQRYMAHADLHFGSNLRTFVQLKSGVESGRPGGPRSIDRDLLDVHQAFVDAAIPLAPSTELRLRLGRQELALGSSRLVSVREGPNVRQTFDGARLDLSGTTSRLSLFATVPVDTTPNVFDDGHSNDAVFVGAYATLPSFLPSGAMDIYALWLSRDNSDYSRGVAREERASLGARLGGKLGILDYDYEAVGQAGSFGGVPIRAWTIATDTAIRLPLAAAPRVGVRADIASGDRPGDGSRPLRAFNALFPRGSYFGDDDIIGPRNFYDVHPFVTVSPLAWVHITAEWDWFWRESLTDGIYNVPGDVLVAAGNSNERFIGHHPALSTQVELSRHASLSAYVSRFVPGGFLKNEGRTATIDFAAWWMTYKF